MNRVLAVVALITGFVLTTHAQMPKPAFEVASIRPNLSPFTSGGTTMRPGGSFGATNMSVARLVQLAYNVLESQVVGGPDWIRNDRFDIVAKASTDVPLDQLRLMVRTLLEERFKLRLRPDKQEMPVVELVRARTEGRVGPNLHDCSNPKDTTGVSSPEKPFTAPHGGSVAAGDCAAIGAVATLASGRMRSVVIDKTGLAGQWRYDIYFSDSPDPGNPDVASFDTALREQLGLKLERTRGIVDVLIVESAEKPTEN